jgi:hypothetical protein
MHAPIRPLLAGLLCLAAGCAEPVAMRQEVIRLDSQWRLSTMEEASFDRMLTSVRGLGLQPSNDEQRILSIPDLLRVVTSNPSSLVRAEALRSAWMLGSDFPSETWRVDDVDREEFNVKTQRLDELISGDGAPNDPEVLELADWLGSFHAPTGDGQELRVAIGLAEVVASQALWRKDELGDVFRKRMASSLHHALVLTTLFAVGDPYPVVREEALASVQHLDPTVALGLVEGVLALENDSAVVLAALDSLEQLAPRLEPGALRSVLEPLSGTTDVAVRLRIRDILARAS